MASLRRRVFLRTPPHFWALAMRYTSDYTAASVPMLPVVATEKQVAVRIVAYSWAMVALPSSSIGERVTTQGGSRRGHARTSNPRIKPARGGREH
jgi:heme O synthase-like polyprenyltransferase